MGVIELPKGPDLSSREEILQRANTPEARATAEALKGFLELGDKQEIAPSDGLETITLEFRCEPDGNKNTDPVHPTTIGRTLTLRFILYKAEA